MASRWLSTARSTLRLRRLSGQVFFASNAPTTRSVDATAHRPDGGPRGHSRQQPAASPAPIEERLAQAIFELRSTAAGADPNQVMFFAPGPVTRADLMRENSVRAHHVRRRHRRRMRYQWLTSNLGVIMAVLALFALVWFVSDR